LRIAHAKPRLLDAVRYAASEHDATRAPLWKLFSDGRIAYIPCMTVAFDTLKLARRLEAAGFPTKQAQDTAEALGDALTSNIATQADIQALRSFAPK